MNGFTFFDSAFPVLFGIVFSFVLALFVMIAVRGLRQWNKNNHSPKLSVAARVVAKREEISHHTDDHNMHSTYTHYYATFEVESGDRMEFELRGSEYGLLAEGDVGELTFQGTRYLGFDRRGTAEPASEEPPIRSTEKKSWDPEL